METYCSGIEMVVVFGRRGGHWAALDLLRMIRAQLLSADAVSLSPERKPDGRPGKSRGAEM